MKIFKKIKNDGDYTFIKYSDETDKYEINVIENKKINLLLVNFYNRGPTPISIKFGVDDDPYKESMDFGIVNNAELESMTDEYLYIKEFIETFKEDIMGV